PPPRGAARVGHRVRQGQRRMDNRTGDTRLTARERSHMRILASVALAALAAGCTAPNETADGPGAASYPALAGADRCAAVTPAMPGATNASGKWVEEADGLPGHCEVTGTLSPASGST